MIIGIAAVTSHSIPQRRQFITALRAKHLAESALEKVSAEGDRTDRGAAEDAMRPGVGS
ncbi:hypothetical protein ACP26L_23260 [Paenibacillus sp. S-38]|uniref:hypothetical protein n=1 Tax=Paenibacillus sp. S-38 TaxID=3416710 RepID=UPI003CF2834E